MSNNPKKRAGLLGYGLEIIENVAIEIQSNQHNKFYLETKKLKMGHDLKSDWFPYWHSTLSSTVHSTAIALPVLIKEISIAGDGSKVETPDGV